MTKEEEENKNKIYVIQNWLSTDNGVLFLSVMSRCSQISNDC